MSLGLEAIANELRRLQRDGVNRVFVKDETIGLIVPNKEATNPNDLRSVKTARNADLRELVKETPTPKVEVASEKPKSLPEPPQIHFTEGDAPTQLARLRDQVLACETCRGHLSDEGKIVFGDGSPKAEIFFCGEAPGVDEALSGDPLTGKIGELLTKMISAMGLSRESVYITNILKWRPEHDKSYGNHPATPEEIRFCLPYLKAQINIIKPKVIVAMGNGTVSGLLGADPNRKMGSIRGTWASFENTPMMITFHPSYLLHNGTLKTKRMAWEDMLQVMEKCSLPVSDKQRRFFLQKS